MKRTRTAQPRPQAACPTVGIGASAGGLPAVERFLHHVPRRRGLAFVDITAAERLAVTLREKQVEQGAGP